MDAEELLITECKIKDNDLFGVSTNLYDEIKFKIAFLIFIIYLIINSDIFVEGILSKFISGTYNPAEDKVTEKGIITSGVVLSLLYILIDIVYEKNYI